MLQRLPALAKVILIFAVLYLFLVGIGSMSTAFKLMGSVDQAKDFLGRTAPPLVSLFIGILATTIMQSSSTSTSIIVSLVAAGQIPMEAAAFMVMGANVGTTVTNTLVSLGHVTQTGEYRRAFAAATVHDFFNLIVLAVFFPLQIATGFLTKLAQAATDAFQGIGGTKLANPIKAATKPAINTLKGALEDFESGGVIMLVIALLLTFGALFALVKLLKSLMLEQLENLFDRLLFKTPYRALFFGMALTVLVQSSSITTSVAVPLAGAGILTIQQVLPYTMGANIGTTCTSLLAALAALAAATPDSRETAMLALVVAFYHVLFNILGVVVMWPFRRLPVAIAVRFAELAMRNRLIPLVYILFTFYLLPFLVIWLGS